MKFFLLFALCAAVASASPLLNDFEVDVSFERFKIDFSRFYRDSLEEQFRKSVFRSNLEFITRHQEEYQRGIKKFTVGINNFTDLTNAEFRAQFNGYRRPASSMSLASSIHTDNRVSALPDTVDWRTKGIVTPVKDQQQCGSCWAFSAVASTEGQHALKTGKLVSLSEQNLVDCSGTQGDMGCEGGWMDWAFTYIIANKGIDTEDSYPYKAIDESCVFKSNSIGATITSYVDVAADDENALQNAVATVGPISVAIDASNLSFQLYTGGVYDEPECSSTLLDHGVTAVGYGTQNGTPYWLVKNSWNTSWGIKGYILMSRNKNNQCGIATKASYPQI